MKTRVFNRKRPFFVPSKLDYIAEVLDSFGLSFFVKKIQKRKKKLVRRHEVANEFLARISVFFPPFLSLLLPFLFIF